MNEALKECCTCREEKDRSEFSKHAGQRDGLQPRCKSCASDYYQQNRDDIYGKIKDRKDRVRQESREFVWDYLLEHPCTDCGESDPVVLDFDHVRGKKTAHVAKIVLDAWGLKALRAEIAKCEVRCANCHRRRTANSLGWYRGVLAARARLDGHQTFNLD